MARVKSTDAATDATVWQATQADRVLQKLDAEDMAFLSGLLQDALRRIAPGGTTVRPPSPPSRSSS
jgi:Tetracyclin repressor-like, C-terminal domain